MSTLPISCARSISMPDNLGSVLPDAAVRFGKQPALFFEGHWSSYRDLDRDSSRLADQLSHLGVGPTSRVVLHVPNSRDWIIAYYGIAKTGAVVVPVDFMLTTEELISIARDSGATVLISGLDNPVALEQIRSTAPFATLILSSDAAEIKDAAKQSDLIAAGNEFFQPVEVSPDALACISYTSGSTGKPKGVMLSHRNILLCAILTAQAHDRNASDVFLSALPCTHVYGNTAVLASILVGGRLVLLRRFDAEAVLASIAEHRVTMFEGVPTMYLRLLSHSRREMHDLRSLTRCTVGGQSMPVAKFADVERLFGCPLIELWGMTELAGAAITHRVTERGPHGSIGRPVPGMEVCIKLDGGCIRSATGEVGELCVRGPLVMQGYLNQPEATAETIDRDGWLCTGDTATIDELGNVRIVGRTKDVIISGGYNIHPIEVENAIAQHPSVASVAVGKSPHEDLGEIVVAYVVLKPGHHALAGEIGQTARNRLAPYKVPRRIVFVEDLPKSGSGKILRNRLEEAKRVTEATNAASSSRYQFVKTEVVDQVGIVVMHGPKNVNALNEAMIREIGDALHEFDRDPSIRCIILRAATPKYFSVGADIREMADRTFTAAIDEDFFTVGWARIAQCRKPVLAEVSGLALGGGCELALMCDLIIASDTAQFGLPEVRLGIFPGAGGTQRLVRQIGKSKAMEVILTGEVNLTAAQALQSGLAARVVPPDDLHAVTLELARKIAANSTLTVRMAKESINRAYESSLAEGLLFERRLFYASLATDDKAEGTKAFLERRPPVFQDS